MSTWKIGFFVVALLSCSKPPCPTGFARDNDGNCIELGGGDADTDADADADSDVCNTSDSDYCDDRGYTDGTDGSPPDAFGWGCAGDCRTVYCNAYCDGELAEYGEYIDCADC